MSGAWGEIGNDFMKMLMTIGLILGGVFVWLLFSISMWLLLLVVMVLGVGYLFFKQWRGSR